jgi:hypothetical protein
MASIENKSRFVEKWPRLSEQLSPIFKWTSGGC